MWTGYECFGCKTLSPKAETSGACDQKAKDDGWMIGHYDGEGHFVCPECKDTVWDALPL